MRKVKSEDRLRRTALARGARVDTDDGTFNSGMAEVAVSPRRKPEPAPPPPPPAPPVPSITMEDVERMLSNRDAIWKAQLEAISADRGAKRWSFDVSYTKDGRVDSIDAKRVD